VQICTRNSSRHQPWCCSGAYIGCGVSGRKICARQCVRMHLNKAHNTAHDAWPHISSSRLQCACSGAMLICIDKAARGIRCSTPANPPSAWLSVCSPSPSPAPSPGPSPSPPPPVLPKLALISQFPASYTGGTANLRAASPNDSCIEEPSARLGGNVSVVSPGPGLCNTDGSVQPGSYNLTQTPPPGTVFLRWECSDVTSGTAQGTTNTTGTTNLNLSGAISVTCVAVYDIAPSPSPGVSPR
jgi:hypothetical protein